MDGISIIAALSLFKLTGGIGEEGIEPISTTTK
jgi:hypothetical protein